MYNMYSFSFKNYGKESTYAPTEENNAHVQLMDALVGNFQSFYSPTQNMAVDETMVGFRGRFGAK